MHVRHIPSLQPVTVCLISHDTVFFQGEGLHQSVKSSFGNTGMVANWDQANLHCAWLHSGSRSTEDPPTHSLRGNYMHKQIRCRLQAQALIHCQPCTYTDRMMHARSEPISPQFPSAWSQRRCMRYQLCKHFSQPKQGFLLSLCQGPGPACTIYTALSPAGLRGTFGNAAH